MTKIVKNLLIILLIAWLITAFLRTGYNITKIFTEEKQLLGLNDGEKRFKFFGENYSFYKFIDENTTKDSKIIFLSPDLKIFYLSRYFLYPKRVFSVNNFDEITNKVKSEKINFLVTYNFNNKDLEQKIHDNNLVLISKYSNKGYLYKIK